jgi:SSS family solute:Na+ symporter
MLLADYIVLGCYLFFTAGFGIFIGRKNKSFNDFMFGGGQIPWLAVGISLIATSVSATTFLGNPADTYGADMAYLVCSLGGVLSLFFIARVFIPRFRSAGINSAYELLELKFSRNVRLLAAGLYSMHLVLRTGILLFGPSLVLSGLLGVNIYIAILITAVIGIGYTWFGGIRAVIWTDVIQFLVLAGGGLYVLWFCANAMGGFGELYQQASLAGKTRWLNLSLDPSQARTLLSAGLVYVVFEIAIRGCDQQFVQRYLSCKSPRDAVLSSVASVVFGFFISLLFFWVGAALYVWFQVKGMGVLPTGTDANGVFPYFIAEYLPPGMTGLLVAAIYAAAMSSLDSAITALSNTTVVDFLGNSKSKTSDLSRAKVWVFIWGLLGTLAALFAASVNSTSLLNTALFFTSLFTGPLLGLFLLAFFFPGTKPSAVLGGAIGGMLSLLPFSSSAKIPGLSGLWEPIYPFSWPWNPLISLIFTLLIAGLLHLMHKMKTPV